MTAIVLCYHVAGNKSNLRNIYIIRNGNIVDCPSEVCSWAQSDSSDKVQEGIFAHNNKWATRCKPPRTQVDAIVGVYHAYHFLAQSMLCGQRYLTYTIPSCTVMVVGHSHHRHGHRHCGSDCSSTKRRKRLQKKSVSCSVYSYK